MKPDKGKKHQNVFLDDQGFPDKSNEFNQLLHNVDGWTVLRRQKNPAPRLDDIDPGFYVPFEEAKHEDTLWKELNISHLPADQQQALVKLVKHYWLVFDKKGLFVPIKDYECCIDTGAAKVIAVKKINYGPQETPIIQQCLVTLKKLGHIEQIDNGKWLFKALLASKPYQKYITLLNKFVW